MEVDNQRSVFPGGGLETCSSVCLRKGKGWKQFEGCSHNFTSGYGQNESVYKSGRENRRNPRDKSQKIFFFWRKRPVMHVSGSMCRYDGVPQGFIWMTRRKRHIQRERSDTRSRTSPGGCRALKRLEGVHVTLFF